MKLRILLIVLNVGGFLATTTNAAIDDSCESNVRLPR
jgi:hypothetical protein